MWQDPDETKNKNAKCVKYGRTRGEITQLTTLSPLSWICIACIGAFRSVSMSPDVRLQFSIFFCIYSSPSSGLWLTKYAGRPLKGWITLPWCFLFSLLQPPPPPLPLSHTSWHHFILFYFIIIRIPQQSIPVALIAGVSIWQAVATK